MYKSAPGSLSDFFDPEVRAAMDEAKRELEAASLQLVAEAIRKADCGCLCDDTRYEALAQVAVDQWRSVVAKG